MGFRSSITLEPDSRSLCEFLNGRQQAFQPTTAFGRRRPQTLDTQQDVQGFQFKGHMHTRQALKLTGGSHLMIVPVFAQSHPAWHDDERLAMPPGPKQGAYARVGNDDLRLLEGLIELRGRHLRTIVHMLRRVRVGADLGQDRPPQSGRHPIQMMDQAWEGQLRPDGDQDQRTEPA